MGLLDTIFSTRVALNGVEVVTRKILNFAGVEIEDDALNGRTNITVSAATLGNRAATSVLGRSAGTAGAAADIAAGADDRVLARSGGVLGFVQVVAAMLANNAVTDAKLRQSAARSVVGRAAGTVGDVADITAGADDTVLARTGGALTFATVATNMLANLAVSTAKIADAAVTSAKLAAGILDVAYSSANASRALAAGDYFRTMLVDSAGGARVITLPKDATLAIPVGTWGVIHRSGANDVSVAAEDGTVTVRSSGSELKVGRDDGFLYWEKRAANTYWISGEKKA
jgi:hypothetical protein